MTGIGRQHGEFYGVISAEGEALYGGGGGPTTSPTFGLNFIDGVNTTKQYTKEKYIFIDSIVFPSGKISFHKSDRIDLEGGKKLDSLSITNQSQLIGSFKFNYGTFNYLSNPGNVFYYTTNANTDLAKLRLKLVSVKHLDGSSHKFDYDETPLPWKNSFAQDYWGYYNGKTTNTSLIPNPARFNKPGLGDNGNNHSAYAPFTQAGILKAINYPTGGKTVFEYELNKFNNYWVPDMASASNTISSGNGLRIASMYFYTSPNNLSTQTYYKYAVGKAIQPRAFFRSYKTKRLVIQNSSVIIGRLYSYDIDEVNANGFFSVNMMGSQSGVGYDTVSKFEGNATGLNGKIVSVYANYPDKTPDLNNFVGLARNISLPACKDMNNTATGSLTKQYFYDSHNKLVRKTENTYSNSNSQLFMGARIFSYPSLWVSYYPPDNLNGAPPDIVFKPITQAMVGFYPIYDFQTLLSEKATTDYLDASLSNITRYQYDQYNQISSYSKSASYYQQNFGLKYPYSVTPTNPVLTAMTASNRLSDIVEMKEITYNGVPLYQYKKTFVQQADKFLESKVDVYAPVYLPNGTSNTNTLNTTAKTTTYDLYNSDNGNLCQYTNLNTTNSLIWGYRNEYVIAEVKNAPYNEVAYTSFEGDDNPTSSNGITNGWAYDVQPYVSALTGGKSYKLVFTGLSAGNVELSYARTLTNGKNYIISFWATGNASVIIRNGTAVIAPTFIRSRADGWTYYETKVTGSGQSLKIAASSLFSPLPSPGNTSPIPKTKYIDEIRLYPENAQMVSYTYNAFGNITSKDDERGVITYYEYDAAGKLINIRDENNNIIKNMNYKLQTQ